MASSSLEDDQTTHCSRASEPKWRREQVSVAFRPPTRRTKAGWQGTQATGLGPGGRPAPGSQPPRPTARPSVRPSDGSIVAGPVDDWPGPGPYWCTWLPLESRVGITRFPLPGLTTELERSKDVGLRQRVVPQPSPVVWRGCRWPDRSVLSSYTRKGCKVNTFQRPC